MKKFLALIVLMIVSSQSTFLVAQVSVTGGVGYGIAYTKTNLSRIQSSYSSYTNNLQATYPDWEFQIDDNFKDRAWSDILSFQVGFSGGGGHLGISYFPNSFRQECSLLRPNGYGRKFSWKEHRNEILFDVGLGTEFVDVFGSLGVNMNTYRMVSYQIYPDGSESLTNEFFYNGVYKQFDAGMTYGLGVKIKPVQFIAIDIRYIFASDLLLGEKRSIIEDNTTLTDNSWAKTVGTSEFPQDFSAPFSFENAIVPNFKKSYFTCSLIFHYKQQ